MDSAGAHVIRPYVDDVSTWPAGSMFSNVVEMGTIAAAIMNDGRVDGVQRLPARAIALMQTPLADVPADPSDGTRCTYTFGLSRCEGRGARTLGHYGFRTGSGAVFSMRLDQRVAVIILANRSGGIFGRTERRVFDLLLGSTPTSSTSLSNARPNGGANALVGVYGSGADTLRVALRADSLRYAYGANPPQRARAASDGALEVLDASGEVEQRFFLVRGKSGAVYLHDGLNAFRRVRRR